MFLEYYGLREQPFGVTPDPRFLYLGLKHQEALASLLYGTQTNRGFQALIAKPGMGKTSLIVQYLQRYSKIARTCYVFQTDCNARELLRHILSQLGIDAQGQDLPGMRDSLYQVLLEQMRAGQRFLLVIDEAQNLDEKVLESVRLLSNFETPTKKLIQIVLAGQPQLAERLASPALAQFRQRVAMVIRLEPLTPEEAGAYIDHRLRVAGYNGPPLFTTRAQLLIAEHSEGIPRNINNLCFNAMSIAYAIGQKQIDPEIVREVISDLEIESLIPNAEPGTRSSSSSTDFAPLGSLRSTQNTRKPRRISSLRRVIPALFSIAAIMLLVGSGISRSGGVRSAPLKIRSTVEAAVQPPTIVRPASAPAMALPAQGAADSSGAGSTPPQERLESASDIRTNRTVSVVIEQGTTLRKLSLKYLGRYNDTTMAEIRRLNPAIHDPNRIVEGKRIRLPSDLRQRPQRSKIGLEGVREQVLSEIHPAVTKESGRPK